MEILRHRVRACDHGLMFLRDGRLPGAKLDDDLDVKPFDDEERTSRRIRCPLCDWQPTRDSRWCCAGALTPEAPFGGCGTVWNTFDTAGRCPGCDHQWVWTSCLRCGGWSLHEDWYGD
jgi:hypothetical protein